jgi:hypothetical protein
MTLRIVSLITLFRWSWTGADGLEGHARTRTLSPDGCKETVAEFRQSRCHEFAIGLACYLRARGLDSVLLVQLVRKPTAERPFFTHAVLQAGTKTYDIDGSRARERADYECESAGEAAEWIELPPERGRLKSVLPFLANGKDIGWHGSITTKVCARFKEIEHGLMETEKPSKLSTSAEPRRQNG